MDFSIVICTYNRAANLPACVAHLAEQSGVESLSWEVLIVDNNSSDDTAQVFATLCDQHPIMLRYAFESSQGLSHARNRGIREADGDHVIFIDDDIQVTRHWLRSFSNAFNENDCDAAGGPIKVCSQRPLPNWIRPDMLGFLGGLDFGNEPCLLDGVNRYPFGGNMAFRRQELERLGGFDVDMGRKGSGESTDELFKGEEAAYFRQLAQSGGAICYVPGASVEHHILPYQLRRRFFLTLHYNEGVQSMRGMQLTAGRKFLGVPLYVIRQTLNAAGRYLATTFRVGPNGSVRDLMTVAYFVGRLRGALARNG